MPTITNPGVIKALAMAFLVNNKDKGKGLRETGYSETYSRSAKGLRLYERTDVKAEITRQQIKHRTKNGRTIAELDKMFETGYDIAVKTNNPTGVAVNTTGIARLYGMDKDSGVDRSEQQILDEAKSIQARKIAEQIVQNSNRRFIESEVVE